MQYAVTKTNVQIIKVSLYLRSKRRKKVIRTILAIQNITFDDQNDFQYHILLQIADKSINR